MYFLYNNITWLTSYLRASFSHAYIWSKHSFFLLLLSLASIKIQVTCEKCSHRLLAHIGIFIVISFWTIQKILSDTKKNSFKFLIGHTHFSYFIFYFKLKRGFWLFHIFYKNWRNQGKNPIPEETFCANIRIIRTNLKAYFPPDYHLARQLVMCFMKL